MSELLGLGESDARVDWLGLRRHQCVFLALACTLGGDWILRSHAPVLELVLAASFALSALPAPDWLSGAELLVVVARFATRSRWSVVSVDLLGEFVAVHGRGDARVRGFELDHRGRLDLSGADLRVAQLLARVADGLATGDATEHASVHVCATREDAATLLTLRDARSAPEGWRPNDELVARVAGVDPSRATWVLERWSYIRTPTALQRILRVHDFSAASPERALLDKLQSLDVSLSLALHFDVVAGARARRLAERAVHRFSSDGAAVRAAGFRRTARAERSLRRLGQREALVADGRALLRVAVYVAVSGATYDELRHAVTAVSRAAHDAGLRCERGYGRQILWFNFQLPGGPGW